MGAETRRKSEIERAQADRVQAQRTDAEQAGPSPAKPGSESGSTRSAGASGPVHGERFTRVERVRRRPEYQEIYEQGTRMSGRFMTVFVKPNGGDIARLGIAATRKLGGAVERNRTKRLVRETFRRNKVQAGLDIVVIPRREMLEADYTHVEADFLAILKRRGTKRRSAP